MSVTDPVAHLACCAAQGCCDNVFRSGAGVPNGLEEATEDDGKGDSDAVVINNDFGDEDGDSVSGKMCINL